MSGVEKQKNIEGAVFLVLFCLTIPLANWMIGHVGTVCLPNGPCLLPVAPHLMAPSGVLMIGAALVLRDLVQRRLGIEFGIGAIVVGALISASLAPAALVIASAAAFLLSEFADFAVYTPLARRLLVLAVLASSVLGLVIDAIVFLWLAFGTRSSRCPDRVAVAGLRLGPLSRRLDHRLALDGAARSPVRRLSAPPRR